VSLCERGHALTHHHAYWYNPDLCATLIANGQLDEAIGCYQRSLELGHVDAWTNLCLGHALTAKRDYERAAHFLRTAIDLQTEFDHPEDFAKYGDSRTRKGPDFIVIGAAKCGTTSLYQYLRFHPQVRLPIWKEIEYFCFPERGRHWYTSHFPRIADAGVRLVTGEASPGYLSIRACPKRVHREYPRVKLVAIIRDPVDRAISHFHHDRASGIESRSMEVALTRELDLLEPSLSDRHFVRRLLGLRHPLLREYWRTERGYVWLGLYANFLENWLKVFSKAQLLVLVSEELFADPAKTMTRVHSFLGLPDNPLARYDVHLQGRYEKESPIRERLRRFYAAHNDRLERLLGRKLGWGQWAYH